MDLASDKNRGPKTSRKVTDEQRKKLEDSLRFPAKPGPENTERNMAIKANRPPQQFVGRRLRRDWDPVLSCGIEEFTAAAGPTKTQSAWRENFRATEEQNALRIYGGKRGDDATPSARAAIEQHGRSDDDTVPSFQKFQTYRSSYGDRPLHPDQKDDRIKVQEKHHVQNDAMWREQKKYELQLGIETAHNRFSIKGRERSAGKSPAQKSFEERKELPKISTEGLSEQEIVNLPPAYRKEVPVESNVFRVQQEGEPQEVKPLTPYKETNGIGMNKSRRPRDIYYSTLSGPTERHVAEQAPEDDDCKNDCAEPAFIPASQADDSNLRDPADPQLLADAQFIAAKAMGMPPLYGFGYPPPYGSAAPYGIPYGAAPFMPVGHY